MLALIYNIFDYAKWDCFGSPIFHAQKSGYQKDDGR